MSSSASLLNIDSSQIAERLIVGRRGSIFTAFIIGAISGCWIAYILLYPFSSLPIPRYTLVVVVVLGWYIDYFARSMPDRLGILLGSSLIAYAVAFVAFTLPALIGIYQDPIVKRTVYLQGLRQVFIFTMPAVILLITGTLGAYVLSRTYDELTR